MNDSLKYRLVIFDLDGTLLNTLDDLYNSVAFALSENGLAPRTKAEVRQFLGNGKRHCKHKSRGLGMPVSEKLVTGCGGSRTEAL